jgi:hypothetical protein
MSFAKHIALSVFFICLTIGACAQKQLLLFKHGHVIAHFNEGEYLRFVLKKKHRHAEGHIVELNDFSMITSNDTVKFKDILKISIKKHRAPIRWSGGVGGFLFAGGLIYLAIDQLNVAIGINGPSSPAEIYTPLIISGIGAAMLTVRSKYRYINGIQYLQTVDYKSPFYQTK